MKPGRKKKLPGEHQQYQRIAILPETYKNIKKLSKKEHQEMIVWLDNLVNSVKSE